MHVKRFYTMKFIFSDRETWFEDQIAVDPSLHYVYHRTNRVLFIEMSLYTMKEDYRIASSFCWNHSYFLHDYFWVSNYHELHVPIPKGMNYHLCNFTGEPYYNYKIAQEILLNSTDSEIQANLTAAGLDENSTREEWRLAAESTTPVATFNFTYYKYGDYYAYPLLECLKDIGIKLNDLCQDLNLEWNEFEEQYLNGSVNHRKLAYSIGGYVFKSTDPIVMMEQLYGTNGSKNYFGLINETWNDKLKSTQNATELTSPTREELFHEIQVDFVTKYAPSFYIGQSGEYFLYNREYLEEESIGDLINIFSYRYWFNCQFTPPPEIINTPFEIIIILGVVYAVSMLIFALISAKLQKCRKDNPSRNIE